MLHPFTTFVESLIEHANLEKHMTKAKTSYRSEYTIDMIPTSYLLDDKKVKVVRLM